MDTIKPVTINWDRALIIDTPIDDDLLKKLTPRILALRQESGEPITIGINSPGGSLPSLDVLLGLLTGPNQDGTKGQIITVATHRAYSAAANLLAFGNYAVAFRHSEILYHDVRFGGMEDVTSEKARDAAKSLQDANDTFALRLARRIIDRLIWIYIDLNDTFAEVKNKYPSVHTVASDIVAAYAPRVEGCTSIDLPGFATALWAKLSSQNDKLIQNVMERLRRWIQFRAMAKSAPTFRAKGSRTPGMLDGVNRLYKALKGRPENLAATEERLKLLLSLIITDIAGTTTGRVNFSLVLERSVREFGILDSMNDGTHIRHATNLMLGHPRIFFGIGQKALDGISNNEKEELKKNASPHATLLWHFCVLLCRELFEGEHVLKPNDAQLLGLIDEVAGGGPVLSKRDFRSQQAKEKATDAATPVQAPNDQTAKNPQTTAPV
jgi:ATP-dependent protease ClpP protease subunit